MTVEDPTARLVAAARDGDQAAIHSLLLRCQPDVTRFARTVCATPEDAEDAVQEALWIAVQRIGTLRVASAFTSWLFQVVKHECYRLLRRVRREEPLDHLAAPPLAPHVAEQALLADDVAKAIATLPPPYRQVLVLRDVQGLTAPEAAATLGLSVPAVKARLHRARTMMRAALQHWHAGHSPADT